jgi:thiamine-monophosphate kinase
MDREFTLIEKLFKKRIKEIPLGVGDDGALIEKNKQTYYVISQDTMNEGTHFFSNHAPRKLGWKVLAANISDISAMGGTPKYALLSLSIKDINELWLKEFSKGFFSCAKKYGVDLIGGDTTRGPTSLSVTIIGEVKKKYVLKRNGALVDEDIWVSGELGLAALGLSYQLGKTSLSGNILTKALSAIEVPKPIKVNMEKFALFFSSAIDTSDGLVQDLQHILDQSNIGALIYCQNIPTAPWIKKHNAYDFALYGGEDYQLVLTSPQANRKKIIGIAMQNKIKLTRIGVTTKLKKFQLIDKDNKLITPIKKGFTHFG